MAQKDYYKTLGVDKKASDEDIKKAYRKLAMKHHPDRNKANKTSEEKFKEINEAYDTLSDKNKKKQYDTFGSGFSGNRGGAAQGNPFAGATGGAGFEDIFSSFGGNNRGASSGGFEFDFSDLFGNMGSSKQKNRRTYASDFGDLEDFSPPKEESLDIEKTYEVPIFDLILGCKIEVEGEKRNKAKLVIPANTKPGTKFRVKDMGKSKAGMKGNLIVKVDARMPKNISDMDKSLLSQIRDNTSY